MSARRLAVMLAVALPLAGCGSANEVASDRPAAPAAVEGVGAYAVGDARVLALFDGRPAFPATLFQGVDAATVAERLRAGGEAAANPDGSSAWSGTIQAFLAEVGGRRVLIDTGAGGIYPGTGGVAGRLTASGVDPAEVDAIVISHMHSDHIGGLIDPTGMPRFPRATLHLHADEAAYWGDPARAAAAPTAERGGFDFAARALRAYRGRVRTFRAPTTIVPGLTAEPVTGHTPGHTVYRLVSGSANMAFLGDMIHSLAVQTPQPEVTLAFDTDADKARAARLAFLRANAGRNTLFAGPHFRAPVVTLAPEGNGYRVTPVAPSR
ncbi:MAG: hypothetical protein AVDCRST_MAG91-2802 [uncultured Sphingomonadaceae bacterium]|uniref:Metallo-beta-lactamase domain-containing protein n=1 Tax=uncultured Sphingomonadaceae bacterium TaxID=169976 RepID=A0A6J4TRT1_9SPHN|nr:MAG: hypothetical protein AVDCRST_MAG91-2802 [uncultured Sphingomonadaceae bacterium]